jgi:threonine dehydratase
MTIDLAAIRAAGDRIHGHVQLSPCVHSPELSRRCGAEIHCKLENLQATGSFKERGACNRLGRLSPDERTRGVIAASAGNHALGLAHHGQLMGIPVTVVMPRWAPLIKLTRCRALGAQVVVHGDCYEDARRRAVELAAERGLVFVHGFEDPDIIAGQGTIGLELLAQLPAIDVAIVPVGGGGLIAGIGTAIKALRPEVRVVGVEARNAPTIGPALAAGAPVATPPRSTLADGLAVSSVGGLCFALARTVVDQVVAVDEAQIAGAILGMAESARLIVEGAGAAPLAAALALSRELAGRRVALLVSGGNIDVSIMTRVIDRELVRAGRCGRLTVRISDRPGSLGELLRVVSAAGASIKDIAHDRRFAPVDHAQVSVSCVVETSDRRHLDALLDALRAGGFAVEASGQDAA